MQPAFGNQFFNLIIKSEKVLPPESLVVLKGSLSLVPELLIAIATRIPPFHTVRAEEETRPVLLEEIQARAASRSYRSAAFGTGNEANLYRRYGSLSLSISTLESPEILKKRQP